MPQTEGDVIDFIRKLSADCRKSDMSLVFYLEDLVKHMGKGIPASAMATYASNWGLLKGAIQYSRWPLHLVNPRTWAASLGLGTRGELDKAEWKRKLRSEAQRLYPHLEITLKTADALLILQYAIKDQVRLGIEQREFSAISGHVPH
jgi:hypothetical protein